MTSVSIDLTNNCEVESDKVLLLRFQNGDEHAFSQIVQRHGLMVRGVCFRILKNSNDCDDAFQATFFILASRANSVNWHESVGGWLHQVARRVSLKLKSNLTRRRRLESNAAKKEYFSDLEPEQSIGIPELGQILDQEISHLPSSFREVILLTQSEGLSRSEAAARLGISVAAVKDRLERGRELLQKRLIKRGLSLSAVALAAWLVPNSSSVANVSLLAAKTSQLAIAFATGKLMGAPLSTAATLAHGTLKILGLQKMAIALTLFLSLITGGSLVFGFLQDNPKRFESGLRGTIVQIDLDQNPSITLELDEYRTLLNLDLSNDAKVWIAYQETSRDKLKVGQFASVRLDVDHRTIKEIHGQGTVREVTIKSVPNPGLLLVEADDDNPASMPEMIELAPETILRIGGMDATLDEFKPGMTVPLEFGSEGESVHAIEPEVDASKFVEGELQSIDLSKMELILSTESEDDSVVDRQLKIETSTIVRSVGKAIPIEELRTGCTLRIRLDEDGQTIKGMHVSFPESDDDH